MGMFSQKPKKMLHGVVVGRYQKNRGWRVKMTGGVFWFALAASAGAQFKPGDAVQALDIADSENKLRISHDASKSRSYDKSA